MFSQSDEEQIIENYFVKLASEPRRFLDIGAHDGITFSNTRALALAGWGGTLVEPSPSAFTRLMLEAYPTNAVDYNLVNVALVPEGQEGLLCFNDSRGDCVSTFDENQRKVWASKGADGRAGIDFRSIFVTGMSVKKFLKQFFGPYDFINLDVEGINYEIFRELPLHELGCKLICVEYQDKFDAIAAHASAQGYECIHTTAENAIFRTK